MNIIDMKTATITQKGQIAIHRSIRDLKGFKEGSKIVILTYEDRVELRPLKQMKKMFTALASEKVLAKDWMSKEDDESWKNL